MVRGKGRGWGGRVGVAGMVEGKWEGEGEKVRSTLCIS